MRFALGFLAVVCLAVMLAPSSLLAQSRTVRGCVEETTPRGVWMRLVERERQPFDTGDLAVTSRSASGTPREPGNRFLLISDDDLLDELSFREGHEVEVTGLINPETSSPAIIEPPVLQPPGGGNVPGAGWPPNPRGTTRVRGPGTGRPVGPFAEEVPIDVILVEEYRAFGPGCRVGRPPGRF